MLSFKSSTFGNGLWFGCRLFLNAFNRMINRRGVPDKIISDNGTNFVASKKELCELICKDQKIQANTTSKGIIKWTFNPTYAPHFGGVFEIMIKFAKRAIISILSNADVKDEELMTAFCGAEALMNSKPLMYQSADIKDNITFTPNHFLHCQMGGQFAPEVIDKLAMILETLATSTRISKTILASMA